MENLWTVRDLGSTNGTRLNALFIGSENRQKSEEHHLRNGDVLILAEEIQLGVQLVTPGPPPVISHTFESHLKGSHTFVNILYLDLCSFTKTRTVDCWSHF